MREIAIIGGTGLTRLTCLDVTRREVVHTPFGEASGPLTHGVLEGREAVFLARHGYGHTIPPHKINYRANLWALREIGVRRVIAVAAVGGISSDLEAGMLAVPDQIIDYTYGRRHTFYEDDLEGVTHIDFTRPYCEALRAGLIGAAEAEQVPHRADGTYAATQGPRLETAAEIDRLERDGCHLVGMTGMPEAALARELNMEYACLAVVANMAAGRGSGGDIHAEIEAELERGMRRVSQVLRRWMADL